MSRKQIVQPTTVVYVSPEGRVRVERCAGEFDLFLDDRFVKTYVSQFAAEQAGLVWLAEQAAELALDVADEAAAQALADEERFLAEVHTLCADLEPQPERPIEAWPERDEQAWVVGGKSAVLSFPFERYTGARAGVEAYNVAGRAQRGAK
jgi:hypothetical protein